MWYNLKDALDLKRFIARVKYLIQVGAIVELTEKILKTVQQNRYLHLILGVMALETGNRMEFVKVEYYKKIVNPDIFIYEIDDPIAGRVIQLRSTADLSKEEMSISIDRFKQWAAENGYYLPDPEDKEALREVELQMGKNKKWL